MFKKIALIGLLVGGLVLVGVYFLTVADKQAGEPATSEEEGEEDIIRLFFGLINEKRIPEAIAMMSPKMAPDDSTRQAWGVQFNDIKSINVQSIEPSGPEQWTETQHTYKVMLEVDVSAEAANVPIPYYGFGDNPNVRWITLSRSEENQWEVDEIASGP